MTLRSTRCIAIFATLFLVCPAWARAADNSTHRVLTVLVGQGVTLEVLDWGGQGLPLILLAGGGDTAHVFDEFAPKLAQHFRVFGITRRGFGGSSRPALTTENFLADRLADDVLEVMSALGLVKPLLVGHSIAGQELSSLGSRHPEKLSGLVYLDAHGPAAFYSPAVGNYGVELAELQRRLSVLSTPNPALDRTRLSELLDSALLDRFEKSARWVLQTLAAMPENVSNQTAAPGDTARYQDAINRGLQMHGVIRSPVLAIAALPHDYDRDPPATFRQSLALALENDERQTEAFASGIRDVRLVRLPYASHYVFRSNEADVIRELLAFYAALLE